ncbi:VWA domain-containing protein [Shewanella avicenniae]|uniref:VWA domain-containing protein n=1 Tax=Shewanella avicenniae TaxID=2814294 RepID=A0ABX7QSD0_9GAMM|nr:VWA domain-containing protein [Shewanella avicenniae]QSX34144.1 VWA domain-containing protein [Shewanella avicenniae]
MSLTILHPWGALLLLALPLIWWLGRSVSRQQRLLRCGLFALLALALMQPVLLHQTAQQVRVVVIDQSASLTAAAKQQAQQLLQQRLQQQQSSAEQLAVVQLGGEPLSQQLLQPLTPQALTYLDSQSSSLGNAIHHALSLIPAGQAARIELISDGMATDNHWSQLLAELALRQVSLDWIAIPAATAAPFIAEVQAAEVRIGQIPTLTVAIEGRSEQSLTLQAWANGELVTAQTVAAAPLNGAQRSSVSLSLPAASQAFSQLTLKLVSAQADSNAPSNTLDEREWLLAAQPAYSVLYASSDASAAAKLQQLLGDAFNVEAANLPLASDIDFSRYHTVMLDNLASEQLPELTQKRLQDAVQQGVGLVYSGADNAFASPEFAKQPIAELLPVELQQQEQQREPSVALAIVIDSSGSMKGRPMELAKQVARLAVKKLKPQDQVGIVEFYGTRQWAVPMQPVENPKEIERAIGRMQAQGGSELFPAIQEAYFGLKNSQSRYRHILLITDAAVEEENYQRLLRFIAQDQINVSAVMVGDSQGGEQRMAELANWGRGRFYAIHDEFKMVELNFHRPSSEPQPVYQTGRYTVQATDGVTLPIPLQGFAKVQAKAAAKVSYQLADNKAPVLSHWRVGAGNVTALMFSPLGSSTQNWQQWPEYGQWLGQQIAASADPFATMQLLSQRQGDELRLQLILSEPAITAPSLSWKAANASEWQAIALTQRSPNQYSALLSVANAQALQLQAQLRGQPLRAVAQASSDQVSELKVPQGFAQLLPQAVTTLNGSIYRADELLENPNRAAHTAELRPQLTATSLYPLCLLLALLLYFVEIIYRRWPTRGAGALGK